MTDAARASAPLGAILAGGQNRRYGAHKALATVSDEPIVHRVRQALAAVVPEVVMVANEPEVYAPVGLPMRPDVRPGAGVLGGILTALEWARELRRPGVIAVACDMPFLSVPLLRRLLEEAGSDSRAYVVAPASAGRRGVEPLCAYYGVGCIGAIEGELDRGELHIVGFFEDVTVRTIPLDEVRGFGDPDVLFLNVNTPEERERAERLAAEAAR